MLNLPTAVNIKQPPYFAIPEILPHDVIFTLIVGGRSFQLSGASLSYDSPSYFTDYFLKCPTSTQMVIDRSAKVFEKVLLHLQGYSIQIIDDFEWYYLLLDSSFYGLQKLKDRILADGMMVSISHKIFKIPSEVFTQREGNYPNLFTIMNKSMLNEPFFTANVHTRPPPMTPIVINKNPKIFEQLLHGLYGNHIKIVDENHRLDLLKDCKYYQFFELEQRLISSTISINPFTYKEEITIKFGDLKKKGIVFNANNSSSPEFGIVHYARPYIDKNISRELIIQFDANDNINLMINPNLQFIYLSIFGNHASKVKSILSTITTNLLFNEETRHLQIIVKMDSSVGELNGMSMENDWLEKLCSASFDSSHSNESTNDENKIIQIKLVKSQWKVNVQGDDRLWMSCLKFTGCLDEQNLNKSRGFL